MKTYKENDWLDTFVQLSKGSIIAASFLMGLGTQVVAFEHPKDNLRFELDGNIANNSLDDWQSVEDGTSSAFSTTHDDVTGGGIIHDELKMSIFTGGGSKDVRDIPLWKWTNGSVPDKDEIMHAAAAAYKAGSNKDELMIYLMGDRYSTDGSAQMGIWFFQEKIGLEDDGTFSGVHRNGDVLMLAEFTQGGAKANIKLYKWNDSKKTNLELFHEGQGDSSHYFLALSNAADTPSWADYTPKSGLQGTYPENAFFEGGINLSWVFEGIQLPCFSSFLMETRSSHRANAQLKDFVLGDLDTCKLEVEKICVSSTVDTFDYTTLKHTYEYTVINSGFGEITNVTFVDDAGTPIDGSDDFAPEETGLLAIGASYSDQYTTTSNQNPPTNTIYATGHIGEYAMAPVQASATCAPVVLDLNISVTKHCKQTLEAKDSHVVVRVDYWGRVCNDQNGTKLVDVYVTDDPTGERFGPYVLYPEDDPDNRGECQNYSSVYYPSETAKVCAHNSTHSNVVTATGIGSVNGNSVDSLPATATCRLCDENGCNEPQ